MPTKPPLSQEQVRELARLADLPLAPGREDVITSTLAAWIDDANALSRKMSAAQHQDLVPATVFTHAPANEAEQ
jgi:hypothetical protein